MEGLTSRLHSSVLHWQLVSAFMAYNHVGNCKRYSSIETPTSDAHQIDIQLQPRLVGSKETRYAMHYLEGVWKDTTYPWMSGKPVEAQRTHTSALQTLWMSSQIHHQQRNIHPVNVTGLLTLHAYIGKLMYTLVPVTGSLTDHTYLITWRMMSDWPSFEELHGIHSRQRITI